jgi:hypothetical protein
VHEWFLVCYGWLALCLRNNFHLAYLFSCLPRLYCLGGLWVSCVAYLINGIALVDRGPFSSSVITMTFDEPWSGLFGPPYQQNVDFVVQWASFGLLDTEHYVSMGSHVFFVSLSLSWPLLVKWLPRPECAPFPWGGMISGNAPCLMRSWSIMWSLFCSHLAFALLLKWRPHSPRLVLAVEAMSKRIATWLILPVVICLSQRLSHACVSMNKFRLWNCEWLIKSVIVCLMVSCYSDNRSNSRANTCNKPRLLEGMHLLDKRSTRALPVAAMIHDNSTDRTALVPATHHSNFCPINFRW